VNYLTKAFCLAAIGANLAACSGGYYVDLAELRSRHPTIANANAGPSTDAGRRRGRRDVHTGTVEPAAGVPSSSVPAVASPSASSSASARTIGHHDESRRWMNAATPWPSRGTPEYDQMLADEAERERRTEQAMRSICRGC
jgi:hypothetical protein